MYSSAYQQAINGGVTNTGMFASPTPFNAPTVDSGKVRLVLGNVDTGERIELKMGVDQQFGELFAFLQISDGHIVRGGVQVAKDATPRTLGVQDGEQLDFKQTAWVGGRMEHM